MSYVFLHLFVFHFFFFESLSRQQGPHGALPRPDQHVAGDDDATGGRLATDEAANREERRGNPMKFKEIQ